jgi:hypothetical protein
LRLRSPLPHKRLVGTCAGV